MSHAVKVIDPNESTTSFHEAKYEMFKRMYDFQKSTRQGMENL